MVNIYILDNFIMPFYRYIYVIANWVKLKLVFRYIYIFIIVLLYIYKQKIKKKFLEINK